MVFLSDRRLSAGRKLYMSGIAAALVLAGGATLWGCGGGGSETDPSPSPTANTNAVVSGRVIEGTSLAPLGGVVVTFGGQSVSTGANGSFEFSVPGGSATRSLTVTAGAGYFKDGRQRGECVENLATAGIEVPASSLDAADRTSLGDIRLYSVEGPPPPPCNF